MSWVQITVDTQAAHTEQLCELLAEAGAQAVTLKSADEQTLLEPAPGDTPLWQQTKVTGLFADHVHPEQILEMLQASACFEYIAGYRVDRLEDQPWERTCLEDFQPMRFGSRLWIYPRWTSPPHDTDAVVLRLDPGLAFGTGTHPTTALCLEWLDRNPPSSRQVLDYGCGSGVLGIAAAKLGAARVWAVDHDTQALTATRDNAAKNNAGACITTLPPDDLPALQVDVILANILAAPLCELAGQFARLASPGATLVLAGILADQADNVARAYSSWFHIEAAAHRDGWTLLTGQRISGMDR